MKYVKKVHLAITALIMAWLIVSCVQPGTGEFNAAVSAPAAKETPEVKPESVKTQTAAAAEAAPAPAEGADLYLEEPRPLTVAQCGQCHISVFRNLKESGGRHRIRCQRCHERFHSYNPEKGNWAELMPRCASCHEQVHGKKHSDCLECHKNPHTPRIVPMTDHLTSLCGDCHTGPARQLKDFPSAHSDQGCQTCHETHGLIPSCMECHEPHLEGQTFENCKACHPVHKPLQIAYDAESSGNGATCGACHEDVYGKWSATKSLHGQVACAECHESHGEVPECVMCHDSPHDAKMMAKFPHCLDCHLDVHNLPVKE